MKRDEIKLLSDKALDYRVELSWQQLDLFHIYLEELWNWNRKINLTGLSTREKMVIDLFLDSLIPAPFLPKKGRMLDVGSGAGFPGLPLKIYCPQLKTHFIEANSKKVNFLKQVIRLLGLKEIEVMRGRIEKDGSSLHPAGYHVITARALADLSQTVAWCAPFLAPGGLLVNFLGNRVEEDLRKSEPIRDKHRVILYEVVPYLLPGKKTERNTIIFKKMT